MTLSTVNSDPIHELQLQLQKRDPVFWKTLRERTLRATDFGELLGLSRLAKKAGAAGFASTWVTLRDCRIALIGGFTFHPFRDLLEHVLAANQIRAGFWTGEYDNYAAEILDPNGDLYRFKPEVVALFPSPRQARYSGTLVDEAQKIRDSANETVEGLLEMCRKIQQRTSAECLVANFAPSADVDPGAYRTRTLASDWSYRRLLNFELGMRAPSYVQIIDSDFIACQRGLALSEDVRGWYETKQMGSYEFQADILGETARLIRGLYATPKKVLILDLDNTLWGGVLGDDGIEGIEIGDTTARGQAFKAFQRYCKGLTSRGVLLAICSKNDRALAVEAVTAHPEMILRPDDFVCFQANWDDKAQNLKRISAELGLGTDSFVFADDNGAEVELVSQLLPDVAGVWLGDDPAEFISRLQAGRWFEPRAITGEDTKRQEQYRAVKVRGEMLSGVHDLDEYLRSLETKAEFREFQKLDMPRIAQLTNKTNQFNLTTIRRTESELAKFIDDPKGFGISVRLKDRFGDHGLISVVTVRVEGKVAEIDGWLMSCRVLQRQVEFETMNEIARLAIARGCTTIRGRYIATERNAMVAGLFGLLGFHEIAEEKPVQKRFSRSLTGYVPFKSHVVIERRAYESVGSANANAGRV